MMLEQLLIAELQLNKMKAEEFPNIQLSLEEARRSMLLKVLHLY
jgi:hypothetical protein